MSGLGSSDHVNLGADRERFGHNRLSSVDGALWTEHGASNLTVFDLRLGGPASGPFPRPRASVQVERPLQRERSRPTLVGMTQNELLIASLTAITATNDDALQIDDNTYIDWSSTDDTSGNRCFEVGGDGDATQVWLTRDQLVELHRKLTLTLLADA